jgi:pimeloyl-ACP methyl ester carboxylesterase
LGFLLIWLVASGCVTSRMAAKRIVEAPNQHDSAGWDRQMSSMWRLFQTFQTNTVELKTNAPLVDVTIAVGPPGAEIRAIEMPPQDYHVKFFWRVDAAPHGRRTMTFFMTLETNSAPAFTPPNPPATIFVLHGYMLSKETMAPWAYSLAQAGYRVILLDLRGHGQSTGDTVSYGKYETSDLSQVLDYLQGHGLCDKSVGVLGYSYGATLALHWAAHDGRVRAVAAIAPYNHPEEAFVRLCRELKIPITRRAAQKAVELAAARLDIRWADWSGEIAIRQVRAPVLLIGGGKDTICPPDDILALQKAAGGEAKTIQIPIADHVVLPLWLQEIADPVKAWFHAHMDCGLSSAVPVEEEAAAAGSAAGGE